MSGTVWHPEDADLVLADWGEPVATATVLPAAGARAFVREAWAMRTEGLQLADGEWVLVAKRGVLALAHGDVVTLGAAAAARDFRVRGPVEGPQGIFDRWYVLPLREEAP